MKTRRNWNITVGLIIFLLIPIAYGAKTIYVPRDYLFIQDAIQMAEHGDTVRVAPGNYSGFKLGKNIRVIGEDRDTTIISWSGGKPGIRIPNRTNASVENFTVREGGYYDGQYCGGIVVMDSTGVQIKNCVIRKNRVSSDYYGASGISIYTSEVTMVDCIVEDNYGEYFAGIYCDESDLIMRDSIIRNNTTYGGIQSASGLFAIDSSVQLENCSIENNQSQENWRSSTVFAGGNGSLTILGCRFADNTGERSSVVRIGSSDYDPTDQILTIRDSVFENNEDFEVGFYNDAQGEVEISRCVFRDDTPEDNLKVASPIDGSIIDNCLFDGVGVSIDEGVITNCTFVNCEQALYVGDGDPEDIITNCIFWDNVSDIGECEYAVITSSCLQEAYPMFGNITDDPQFIDPGNGDYRLSASSPCIDNADNNPPGLGERDLEGKPRKLNGGTSLRIDMGCYEYPSDVPSAVITDFEQPYIYDLKQTARFTFLLFDSDSTPAEVTAEYSLNDGADWESASGTFSSAGPFGTSPLGTEHEFYWEVLTDLPWTTEDDVLFRLSPSEQGGSPGNPDIYGPFDVSTMCEIIHYPASFTFNVAGEYLIPSQAQELQLNSTNTGLTSWLLTGIPEWLDVSPKFGNMGPDGIKVTITVQPDGMATGTYVADLTLKSPNSFNTPQTITVTLNVGVVRTVHVPALGIQDTIDISNPGDVVEVLPGKYIQTITLNMAPNVSLVGSDAGSTIIVGNGKDPVITAEGINSILIKGLTLKLGLFGISGTYSRLTIEDVTAQYNHDAGFAFYKYSDTTLANCTAVNNASTGLDCNSNSAVTAENCLFANNGYAGVQAFYSPATLTNCTIATNAEYGVLSRQAEQTITNCIIYGNGDDLDGCDATYSCIGDGDTGTGNISDDPGFVNADYMHYRITSGSPCVNTGTPAKAPVADFEHETRTNNPDMGYDEFVDNDGAEMQSAWENANGLDPENPSDKLEDADFDDIVNYDEYVHNSGPSDNMSPMGTVYVDAAAPGGDGTISSPFTTIQEGIDAAWYGDTVCVASGTYDEELMMKQMVELTGNEENMPLVLAPDENSNGILCYGLTSGHVKNFKFDGSWDGFAAVGSSAEIENCEFFNTSKSGVAKFYNSGPVVYRNLLIVEKGVSGINSWMTSEVAIENCTAVGKDDTSIRDYGVFSFRATTSVVNSILWDNKRDLVDCSVTYSDIGTSNTGTGNIFADPLFVSGLLGDYYLSQIASGQASDSPCADAGSDYASNLGFIGMTTRTDQKFDTGIIDVGYHYKSPLLQIYSIVKSGDEVTIRWNAREGGTYVVQWSNDLDVWHDVPVGSTDEWTDTEPAGAVGKLYRVIEE